MVYKVGNLIFNKDVGILSSLVLGLSVFHIRYSQEARTYSLSALLTLLSIYFFIKLLRKKKYSIMFGYILSSALLIHSHIYGLFIIISQNIYFISSFLLPKKTYKLNLKRWILIQIILIILFIPWVNIFITQTKEVVQSDFWISMPSLQSIIKSFITYSGSKPLFWLFLIFLPFSTITYEKIRGNIDWDNIFQSIKSYRWKIHLLDTNKIFLLLAWLLTPIILPFIISRFLTPVYHTRYTIVASLAFYLLVSKGISNIHHKYFKIIVISVVIVFSLVSIRGYYTKINKEQWRDVAHYVDTTAKNGDLLLFNSGDCIDLFNYYSKRTDLIKKSFPEKSRYVDEENIKELKPTLEGYQKVWLILSHSRDEKGLITKRLNRAYNLSYREKYIGIEISFFERRE